MKEYSMVWLGIGVILFFVFRELFCWYYKVNERIELQRETNRLLKKIAGEDTKSEDQLKKL